MIIFFICSDLLNCLRSVGTLVITTESDQNSLKVIFTERFLTKGSIFWCFDVFSVWPPQIFQVQAKISTIQPLFPDYLSISYDYVLMENVRENKFETSALYYRSFARVDYLLRYKSYSWLLVLLSWRKILTQK